MGYHGKKCYSINDFIADLCIKITRFITLKYETYKGTASNS